MRNAALATLAVALNVPSAIAWDATTDAELGVTVARELAGDGASLAVYRNPTGDVFLRFTARPGLRPARAACPTFQIDTRRPLHHYTPGASCAIDGSTATYHLATISNGNTQSLPLYRLMNGTRVAFRFGTLDGGYGESIFGLRGSKQAMLAALGRPLTVDPGTDE